MNERTVYAKMLGLGPGDDLAQVVGRLLDGARLTIGPASNRLPPDFKGVVVGVIAFVPEGDTEPLTLKVFSDAEVAAT